MSEFISPAERKTHVRNSLAYPKIGSEDFFNFHPSGRARIIAYHSENIEQISLLNKLIKDKLVLGKVMNDPNEPIHFFNIPISARPISYDASSNFSGALSYNDDNLFYDLGRLFAKLEKITDKKLVVAGDIGRCIAYVEFSRPDQERLFFTPGIEKIVEELPEEISVLGYYAEKLIESFGSRFENSSIYLRTGYSEAISETVEG